METKMKLVYTHNGKSVEVGHILEDGASRWRITGWRAPHTINSSGRIFVRNNRVSDSMELSYFPHVFGCKFVPAN